MHFLSAVAESVPLVLRWQKFREAHRLWARRPAAVIHSAPHPPRISRRLLSFLLPPVAAALALGVAATQAGAAGWITGTPVSAAGDIAVTPAVALSPSGERFVAWVRLAPGSSDELGSPSVVAPPGGDFGPVQLLADPDAEGVSLTTGSDGTAALVWTSIKACI